MTPARSWPTRRPACLAFLDGLPGPQAVAYVRLHYAPRAIETPWQRRFATRFRTLADPGRTLMPLYRCPAARPGQEAIRPRRWRR